MTGFEPTKQPALCARAVNDKGIEFVVYVNKCVKVAHKRINWICK